jgi:arabinogalactan oligomer/maltooligosaccharide transport system substrate-binding protein
MMRRVHAPVPAAVAFVLLLVTSVLVFLVSGCAPRRGGSADGPIVVWVQMDPDEKARFDRNLEAWRAAHPGEQVDVLTFDTENLRQQFQTQAAAGAGPDLVFGPSDQVGPLSLVKLLRPLDTTLPAGFFDRFVPASLDTLDGHLWQAPDQVGNHLMLLYNRKLVPVPPTTHAELVATGRRLTARAGKPDATYGFVLNTSEPYWLAPYLGGFGGWVLDGSRKPTLDTPAMVAALRYLKSLRDEAGIMPREADYQVAETLFKEGRAAMIVNGPWAIGGYRSAGIDLGAASLPRLPNGNWPQPMIASKGYSISVNVPEAKLPRVVGLVTYLTGDDAQRRDVAKLGFFPSSAAAFGDSSLLADPVLAGAREALGRGRRMPVVPEMRVVWDAMRPNLQDVMNGAKTPEHAAADMQATATAQITALAE